MKKLILGLGALLLVGCGPDPVTALPPAAPPPAGFAGACGVVDGLTCYASPDYDDGAVVVEFSGAGGGLAIKVRECSQCPAERQPPPLLPICDTLRAVFFVQRCNLSDKAECRLYATAPAGSMATGCTVPVVDATSGAVTLLECGESCK